MTWCYLSCKEEVFGFFTRKWMNKEGRSKQCRIFRDLCLLKYKKLPAEDASFQESFTSHGITGSSHKHRLQEQGLSKHIKV